MVCSRLNIIYIVITVKTVTINLIKNDFISARWGEESVRKLKARLAK